MRSFEPPSNQMALPGLDPVGEERMRDARRWVATHRHEFEWYKAQARRECSSTHDRKASPNRCLYGMRITFSVVLPNHLAPYLARIAMEEDPEIRMRVARSDADQYTTAVIR